VSYDDAIVLNCVYLIFLAGWETNATNTMSSLLLLSQQLCCDNMLKSPFVGNMKLTYTRTEAWRKIRTRLLPHNYELLVEDQPDELRLMKDENMPRLSHRSKTLNDTYSTSTYDDDSTTAMVRDSFEVEYAFHILESKNDSDSPEREMFNVRDHEDESRLHPNVDSGAVSKTLAIRRPSTKDASSSSFIQKIRPSPKDWRDVHVQTSPVLQKKILRRELEEIRAAFNFSTDMIMHGMEEESIDPTCLQEMFQLNSDCSTKAENLFENEIKDEDVDAVIRFVLPSDPCWSVQSEGNDTFQPEVPYALTENENRIQKDQLDPVGSQHDINSVLNHEPEDVDCQMVRKLCCRDSIVNEIESSLPNSTVLSKKKVKWADEAKGKTIETISTFQRLEDENCRIFVVLVNEPTKPTEFLHCEFKTQEPLKISHLLSQLPSLQLEKQRALRMQHSGDAETICNDTEAQRTEPQNSTSMPLDNDGTTGYVTLSFLGKELISILTLQDYFSPAAGDSKCLLRDGMIFYAQRESSYADKASYTKAVQHLMTNNTFRRQMSRARMAGRYIQQLKSSAELHMQENQQSNVNDSTMDTGSKVMPSILHDCQPIGQSSEVLNFVVPWVGGEKIEESLDNRIEYLADKLLLADLNPSPIYTETVDCKSTYRDSCRDEHECPVSLSIISVSGSLDLVRISF
jgi:hypothetical protein